MRDTVMYKRLAVKNINIQKTVMITTNILYLQEFYSTQQKLFKGAL